MEHSRIIIKKLADLKAIVSYVNFESKCEICPSSLEQVTYRIFQLHVDSEGGSSSDAGSEI